MKRVLRKIAYAALALTMALASLGCAVGTPSSYRPAHPRDKELGHDPEPQAIVRHPLTVITKRTTEKECEVLYPYVIGDGMSTLNISVYTAFEEFREDCGAQGGRIEYSVEFNRYGLLSLIMTYLSEDGKPLAVDTANFNTDTGLRVTLRDCFGSTDGDYAARLAELVRRYAEANDLTFISGEPAFDESTRFLFTFGGMLLVYREYELFTYDAGSPRIRVRASEIASLIAADGLLNRLK